MEAYVAGGETRLLARRALADRLPQAVLDDRSKGLQGVDWHEGLNGAREDVRTELNRLSHCDPAARILDIERLRSLVDSWPKDGWSQDDIMWSYRLALLRGVATGHFLRKASGSNA
jgi:asparagine synthase (glutamine-hydrolysing)